MDKKQRELEEIFDQRTEELREEKLKQTIQYWKDKKEHDLVDHPKHYTSHPSGVECIEITRHMTFNCGCAMKYIWRNGLKEGNPSIQDFEKAIFHLQDEIKRIKRAQDSNISN